MAYGWALWSWFADVAFGEPDDWKREKITYKPSQNIIEALSHLALCISLHSFKGMLFCSKDTEVFVVLLLHHAVSCLGLFMLFPVCSIFILPSLPGKLLLFLVISFQTSSLLWEVFDSFRQTRVSFPLFFLWTAQLCKLCVWTWWFLNFPLYWELQVGESLIYHLTLGPNKAKQMLRVCLLKVNLPGHRPESPAEQNRGLAQKPLGDLTAHSCQNDK